jgi:hypothetical protein
MKVLLSVIAVLVLSLQLAHARECQYENGEARWDIKTSVPQDADVDHPQAVDLDSLVDLANPDLTSAQIHAIADARWDGSADAKNPSGQIVVLHEGDIITVDVYLYRARCQKDGDYHMEIGVGRSRQSSCIIAEVPDPGAIHDPHLRTLASKARDTLEGKDTSVFARHATKPAIKIKVTGQFFLDETHHEANNPGGGRGTLLDSGRHCATNLWEIHPVLRID